MSAVQIGPLVFDIARFAAILAALVLVVIGGLVEALARRQGRPLHLPLVGAMLAWVLGARALHVFENRAVFAGEPLSVLAFWQGGFSVLGGFAGLGLVLLVVLLRRPATGMALAGVLTFSAGTGLAVLAFAGAPALALPERAFAALTGPPVVLSQREGRPLVLNLWASWCPPCRREMPMMMELAAAHPGVDVIFANQGEDRGRIEDFLDLEGLAGAGVVLDPDSALMRELGAIGLPTTLFFDAEGRVSARVTGELSRAAMLSGMRAAGGDVE